jgi:hypothetical protein
MAAAWTVRDGNGQLLADFTGGSPMEVGRRIVPGRYDAFRLQVSSSYREVFDRAVNQGQNPPHARQRSGPAPSLQRRRPATFR